MYDKFLKRGVDFIIASIGIIIFSPVFLLLCFIIKLDSKGPVFFKQKRVGKDKVEFYIIKFRSMKVDAPKYRPTNLLENPDKHITRFGKLLRKTSLDELPQLLNIIVGEMSIVGPRPALRNQVDLISERDKYRANDIRPGLTGWAQINGRDKLENHVKAQLDGEYVRKMSFWFDLKCMLLTIVSVFKAKDVVEGGGKTNNRE